MKPATSPSATLVHVGEAAGQRQVRLEAPLREHSRNAFIFAPV
jgi:hypothetical protein